MDEEPDKWPIYALADYANSGRLLERCRALLMSPGPANDNDDDDDDDDDNRNRSRQRSDVSERGTTPESIWQTSRSSSRRRQQRGSNRATRANNGQIGRRPTSGAPQPPPGNRNANWHPSSWLHKSQHCRQRTLPKSTQKWPPSLSWRHLIEPVNYGGGGGGKLARAGHGGRAQLGQVMDRELDSLYRTRVQELSHEIGLAVSNFMVESGPLEISAMNLAGASKKAERSPPPSPGSLSIPSRQSDFARGGVSSASRTPERSPEAQAARLRRLSWRQKLVGRRVAPTKLVRSETFDLNEMEGRRADAKTRSAPNHSGASSQRLVCKKLKRIDAWLADTDRPRSAVIRWSDEPGARGLYGESLIHVLLVNHTDECLTLLVLLLKLWPSLLLDTLKSNKFRGLNCLHLVVAYGNQSLLEHLLELAATEFPTLNLVHEQVTGSLFRSPLKLAWSSSSSDSSRGWLSLNRNPTCAGEEGHSPRSASPFWCDQQEHWPTANGSEHLILYDRIEQMVGGSVNQQQQASSDHAKADRLGSSFKRTIYFGQSPLAWAVGFDSKDMFELLASRGGADAVANSRDHQQNNCLHLLIINDQRNWTRFLLKFSGRLSEQRNSMQLSPFLLACHLGRVELFNELLELSAVEFWTYSSVRCCAYPLASLDPIVVQQVAGTSRSAGRKRAAREVKSAVSVILESECSSDEQKAALLATGVIKRLLEEKWKLFARRLFYTDLSLTLFQLVLTTFACFMRPSRLQSDHQQEARAVLGRGSELAEASPAGHLAECLKQASKLDLLRNSCELLIVTIALNRIWAFSIEWFRYKNLSLQFTYNPLVANLVLANLLIIACVPVRAARFWVKLAPMARQGTSGTGARDLEHVQLADGLHRLDQLEESLLILASPLLWSSLLFFVAAFQVTGPFVAMINYMLMRDAKQFSLIYLVFLSSFAQSIFFTNSDVAADAAGSPPTTPSTPRPTSSPRELTDFGDHAQEAWWGPPPLLKWVLASVADYTQLWLELFKMTLGVYELQPFRRSLLSRGLLMLFIQLIPILFNMLIAMMNNTYSRVISQSERAWSFQWARTLFALERRLSHEQKVAYLKRYAINLSSRSEPEPSAAREAPPGGGDAAKDAGLQIGESTGQLDEDQRRQATDESGQFVPGLMIIKQTNCTKAELRRRLVDLWQKSARRLMEQGGLGAHDNRKRYDGGVT